MKKIIYSLCIVITIFLCFYIGVSASENQSFVNGSTMYNNGSSEFYSNSDDEDKLYQIDLSNSAENKLLDDHIISVLGDEDCLYLLSYTNGHSNLLKYDTKNYNCIKLLQFDKIVNNFAMRDSIIYYVEEKTVKTFNLNTKTIDVLVKNTDLMYFADYNTLKYLEKDDNGNYITKIYSFNELKLFPANTSNETISLMSASSYSPRLTAPATNNAYYTSLNVFHTSGYGMVGNGGNCTCYAYGRSYENLGYKPSLCTRNAENWYSYNANGGYYSYGKAPNLGAVAVWSKGVIGNSDDGAGHVAVVEVIDGNTCTTSESGWGSYYFKTVTRYANNSNFSQSSSYSFQGFIYVMGSSPNPPTTSVPTNTWINTDKSTASSNDTVTLSWGSDNATSYWLHIYRDGQDYVNQGMNSSTSYSHTYPVGQYTAWIQSSNSAGNELKSVNFTISIPDTEAPTITNVYTSGVNSKSFAIHCTLNDNVGVSRVWLNIYGSNGNNGFEIATNNGEFSYIVNVDDYGGAGTFEVHIYAFDQSGNSTSVSTGSICSALSCTMNNSVAYLSWTSYSDTSKYAISIYDGELWKSNKVYFKGNITGHSCSVALEPGNYQAYVDVCDSDGNYIRMGGKINFTVQPTVAALRATANNSSAYFSWSTYGDDYTYALIIYDGQIWESNKVYYKKNITGHSCSVALEPGNYQAYVDIRDSAGNYVRMGGAAKFIIQSSVAELNVQTNNNTAFFDWYPYGDNSTYTLIIYDGQIWESNKIYTQGNITEHSCSVALKPGNYQAYVDVRDSSGNYIQMGGVKHFNITIDYPYTEGTVSKTASGCNANINLYNIPESSKIIVTGYKDKKFVTMQTMGCFR